MERKPPSSIDDFVSVIKRRKYWILIPSVVLIALGMVLAPMIPRTYKSTTTIMVTSQSMPSVYVKSAGGGDGATRLEEINLQVMKGTGFPEIIEKYDLYPLMRKKTSMTRVVAAMRKDLSVDEVPDAGDGRGGVLAFTISYIGRTPQQAQDVTKAVAQLFIDENLREGRNRTQGAYAFLTSQLNAASQRLASQQAKMQAFKMSHMESLPEQAQANMQTIGQIQSAMQTNEDALAQGNQQRVYLQSVLNVKQNGNSSQAITAPPPATPLQVELSQKQQELRADLLKYTPEHPDVIRLKHDIAVVENRDPECTQGKQSSSSRDCSAASDWAFDERSAEKPTDRAECRHQNAGNSPGTIASETRSITGISRGRAGGTNAVRRDEQRLRGNAEELQRIAGTAAGSGNGNRVGPAGTGATIRCCRAGKSSCRAV